jgi:multiple sugar transport system permease protein
MSAVATAAARPQRSRRWQTFRKQAPNYLFILPHFAFFLLFLAWPVVFGFWISFHHWEIISPSKPFVGLENYQDLLTDDIFFRSTWNTVRFAVFTVVAETVLGLAAALLVNQRFPGRLGVRIILFAPRVLSVATMAIVWQWLMNRDWGGLNYVLSLAGLEPVNWLGDRILVVPSIAGATTWWVVGFAMIIYLAGLQGIPEQLYEAAKIDGATDWQQFRRITLPLLAPTTLFVVVTSFIAHMQVFGQVYAMTTGAGLSPGGPDFSSMSVVMYLYDNGFRYYRMGYASAMAFVLAAMIMVITVVQFKMLNKSVEY